MRICMFPQAARSLRTHASLEELHMTPARWITAIGLGMVAASVAIADITNITQGTTHPTIQDAIDQANDHDEIVLDPGVYDEYFIELRGKPLTVRSQDPHDPTIVAETVFEGIGATVFYVFASEGPDTVITGFVFTGAADANGAVVIWNASPTISHCTFQSNISAGGGGAILMAGSSATITDCAFVDNRSIDVSGGAIHIIDGSPMIRDCTFDRNATTMSLRGGALALQNSTATIERCRFRRSNAVRDGGAVHVDASVVTFVDCSFIANEVSHTNGTGGAVCLTQGSTMTATGCEFFENEVPAGGGAISLWDGSHATITDTRIESNECGTSGGGIHLAADGVDTCSVQNSVVAANVPDQIAGAFEDLGGNVVGRLTAPPRRAAKTCPEDINGDGVVNLADLGALLAVFDQPCP
jgi:predicted outer membrane repeat protein